MIKFKLNKRKDLKNYYNLQIDLKYNEGKKFIYYNYYTFIEYYIFL
jgi:hypothetical protein